MEILCSDCIGAVRLGALPGSGWDNLRNNLQIRVIAVNFSECETTEDGVLQLPSGIQVIPVKNSKVDMSSTIIENMEDYKSVDSVSVNLNLKLPEGHFSFSTDYQKTKEKMRKQRAMVSRSQLWFHRYTAITSPSIDLDPKFKNRLMDIAYSVQEGDMAIARYNAERLVADYGTHYIDRVDIGGILVQEDMVRSEYVKDMDNKKLDIAVTAGASFLDKYGFDLGTKYTHSTEALNEYRRNCTESSVITYGGEPYREDFSINSWIDSLNKNLVVIDRDGDLISALISPEHFPGIPFKLIQETSQTIQKAIKDYYKYNTHYGCSDMDSPNFEF